MSDWKDQLLKGLTDQQKGHVTENLKKFAEEQHARFTRELEEDPDNGDLQVKAVAWEFICQNLGIPGYDWS